MTAPQSVTERYVSNLLHYGRNKEFDVLTIEQDESTIEGEHVGFFYFTKVKGSLGKMEVARGATISQALRRCLEKHGVTFR